MENRIKECQLDLFADRTSAASLRANQLRLWFASLAYVLMTALRRMALQGTELATGHRRNHPAQAPEAWRARHGQRPPRQDRHRLGLPAMRGASRRPIEVASVVLEERAFDMTRPSTASDPNLDHTRSGL